MLAIRLFRVELGHSLVGSYPSAKMESVYSLPHWATTNGRRGCFASSKIQELTCPQWSTNWFVTFTKSTTFPGAFLALNVRVVLVNFRLSISRFTWGVMVVIEFTGDRKADFYLTKKVVDSFIEISLSVILYTLNCGSSVIIIKMACHWCGLWKRSSITQLERETEFSATSIIIIMSCPRHGYPWHSLATSPNRSSPLVGLRRYIPYPHIAAVCRFELVVLLLPGHMRGSIRVHLLWARSCFSSRALRVWFV